MRVTILPGAIILKVSVMAKRYIVHGLSTASDMFLIFIVQIGYIHFHATRAYGSLVWKKVNK